MSPTVNLRGITQHFGSVKALQDVDFQVEAGDIHALIGENGAGKTTLMRVLYGALRPMSGTIEIFGEEKTWRNASDAIAHGIGMVSQHYSIIPELTCLQNLMLGAEPSVLIAERQSIERAAKPTQRMGFAFDWRALAQTLSPSGAQKLEIVKLLWRESKIMILDEPTAMLSPADSDALFASLRQLAAEGATIIIVTHRLPEVMAHCDRVTVLRDGKKVADLAVSDATPAQLAELIVGHTLAVDQPSPLSPGADVLRVTGLVVKGDRGDEAVKGANFTIRSGEVVGLAGVDGNGQRELFHALIGFRKAAAGQVHLNDRSLLQMRPAGRIAAGLRLIPEDRHAEGVIEEWNLIDNAMLGLQRLHPISDGWLIDRTEGQALAERVARRFKTKHAGLTKLISSLSGGNQQRFVAARALELDPSIVLAFQPTRGLDIDGAAQVYAQLRELCRSGAGALVVSFDLDELLENCDRVLVINRGEVLEPSPGEEHDRQAIGRLMVGA